VLALDPPPVQDGPALVGALPGSGFAHCAWGPGEETVARETLAARADVRATVVHVYRALRDAGPVARDELEPALDGTAARADCAFALSVLLELSLIKVEEGTVRLVEAPHTQLDRSRAYATRVAKLAAAAAALEGTATDLRAAA
jgi:hypothetical protein